MSNPSNEDHPTEGISDEQLPEDLRPSDDNPLAKDPTDEDAEAGTDDDLGA